MTNFGIQVIPQPHPTPSPRRKSKQRVSGPDPDNVFKINAWIIGPTDTAEVGKISWCIVGYISVCFAALARWLSVLHTDEADTSAVYGSAPQ